MLKKTLSFAVIAALGVTYASYNTSTENALADQATAEIAEQDVVQDAALSSRQPSNIADSILAKSPEAAAVQLLADRQVDSVSSTAHSAINTAQAKDFFARNNVPLQRGENVFFTGDKSKPLHAITANDAKDIILKGGRDYLAISPGDDLTLMTAKRDQFGNVIYKYSQTYEDLKVFGRELVVQINNNDEVAMIGGQYEPEINLPTTPKFNAQDALNNAYSYFDDLPADTPNMLTEPELMVYADGENKPVLTYVVDIEYLATSGYKKEKVFVDANLGKLVNSITLIHSALTYSIHSANNTCLSENGSGLPGTVITRDDGEHAAGVDDNTRHAYYFYKNMFGRDSWDNKGRKVVSTIHAKFKGSNGQCGSDNAFFEGSQFVFGDGSTALKNPGAAIDIFGHEFTHGFTASESNLTYQNESGAINEAMSDVMGTGVSIWQRSGGTVEANPSSLNPTDKDWDMGEDAALQTSWQRHMDDPAENGASKDNYPERNTGTSDSGGVHTNSGIMNLAFYMLSEGGTHPRQKSTNTVTGIGVDKALRIYYYANENLFTSSTNFQDARGKLATAAKTLYGCDEWESVHQSYDAVKVPGTRGTECADTTDEGTGDGGTDGGTGDTTPVPTPDAGGNIAVGSAYQASSTYSSRYPAQNSTDANSASLWVSRNIYNTSAEEYVMMNLGSNKTFSSVNISWNGSDAAGSVAVWVWKNSRWTMVGSSNGSPASKINFAAQQGQYVMLTMKNGKYSRWYAISEIAIQ